MVKTLFGINLKDTQCGAKLFKKEAIKKIVDKLGIANWGFDVELLYLMKLNNFKVIEIPTEWTEPGGSRMNVKKTIYEMFLSNIRLRLAHSRFRFIVRIYDKVIGDG